MMETAVFAEGSCFWTKMAVIPVKKYKRQKYNVIVIHTLYRLIFFAFPGSTHWQHRNRKY